VELLQEASAHPDLALNARPRVIVGVLAGAVDLAQARALGLQAEGDEALLERVAPAAPVISA
jgi:hypothetical protein